MRHAAVLAFVHSDTARTEKKRSNPRTALSNAAVAEFWVPDPLISLRQAARDPDLAALLANESWTRCPHCRAACERVSGSAPCPDVYAVWVSGEERQCSAGKVWTVQTCWEQI